MDLETRIALLERAATQHQQEALELRDMLAELNQNLTQLNQWQARIDVPIKAAGFFFIGLLTAAGYGVWAFITHRLG